MATLSTVTVTSDDTVTDYTTTCDESHISKTILDTVSLTTTKTGFQRGSDVQPYSTTSSVRETSRLVPVSASSPTIYESSQETISLSKESIFATQSTAASHISERSSKSMSSFASEHDVIASSTIKINSTPESTARTTIVSSGLLLGNTVSSITVSQVIETSEEGNKPTFTASGEKYSSTSSASVTTVIASAYAGDAARSFLNPAVAIAVVLPFALV